MVKIRDININTKDFWNDLHRDPKSFNSNIWRQFERFFSLGFLPIDEHFTLLDIGCGDAFHLSKIKQKYIKVIPSGLDISLEAVEKSKKYDSNISYYNCNLNIEDIPVDFDYIVSQHTFEHFDDPVAVLKKCKNHCRKDIIICVPYEDAWAGDSSHVHKFTFVDPFDDYKSHKLLKTGEIFFVFDGELK